MLSAHLPFFPEGITHITANLAFKKENGSITSDFIKILHSPHLL